MFFLLPFFPIGFLVGAVLGAAHKKKRESYRIKFIESKQIDDFFSKENFQIEKASICSVCGIRITRDNIGVMTKKEGKIYYVCNKPHCQKFERITA